MVPNEIKPTEKSPWGKGTLITVFVLGSFIAGGIIAAINWHRMGRHRLVWPTIIAGVIALIVWISIIWTASIDLSKNVSLTAFVNGAFAWGVWRWQRNHYKAWKESHPHAQRAGWGIPVLAVIVFLALPNFLILGSMLTKAPDEIEYTTYENLSWGMRVQYPSHWKKEETQEGSLFNVCFKPPALSGLNANVNLTLDPSPEITPDDAVEGSCWFFNELCSDYKLVSLTDTTCSGIPAKKIVITGKVGNKPFKFMQITTGRFTFGYGGRKDEYQQLLDQAEKIASSVELF